MKKLVQRILHAYQFALDYPLYWKLRIGVCKWGGENVK